MHLTEEQYQEIVARQQAKHLPPLEAQRQPRKLGRPLAAKNKPSPNQPNKTERRFEMEILKPTLPADATYGFQRLTFLLAPGLRYTPDYIAWQESDFEQSTGWLTCYEVKGAHVWDDARVKFLTARELFPWITWQAWQWKGGEWREIWTA